MPILVTGGTGYIGSHVCVALLQAGHSVVALDNLANSSLNTVAKINSIAGRQIDFYEIDARSKKDVSGIFEKHKIEAVIHLAGYKAVGESVEKPLLYYHNNIVSTIILAQCCETYGVNHFIFSSSATVYGNNRAPFYETMANLIQTSPYGETKMINEMLLRDLALANPDLSVVILRYFNPIGAHESGLIGDTPRGIPNNLMPYITQVAKGKLKQLKVFGNDYPTPDGTGIRDYVHVVDLAEGHVAALRLKESGAHIINLGIGKGTSVIQILNAFEAANAIKIPYEVVGRRPGDVAESYADVSKAKSVLGWVAKRDVMDMCRDAWRFENEQAD